MDVFEAIKNRRSVRLYQKNPVDEALIKKVIDAARFAPSGANFQPWKFIVVTNEELRMKIGKSAKFFFVKSHHVSEAPVLIACLADMKKSKWAVIDTSMASQNLMLAAHALRLGTCFVGVFDEEETKRVLSIPEHFKVIGLITLGHPARKEEVPNRLPVEEITYKNVFGKETIARRAISYTRTGPVTVWKKILRLILKR